MWPYHDRVKKIEVTDEMVDAELARQEQQRHTGLTEVVGRVETNLTPGKVFLAVLLANLCTGLVIGCVVLVVAALG